MGRKLFVAIVVFLMAILGGNTYAVDARRFRAENIIDDAIFTNSDSMSVEQIKRFLESKVKCDTNGQKRYGNITRAQWLNSKGWKTPIRCMTDYVENPNTRENNYGNNNTIQGGLSAAQIIYNYSKQFNINPQVILVTLQKENGMITDDWPNPKQYSEAMGFGCPDNVAAGAPACDPSYKSFSSQVYQAARHFRGYMDAKSGWFVSYNTGNNFVGYHPNRACGGSTVNIENRATVALYTYTPYQPNQAALNAQYGTGDGCSSYGNRNFFNYFSDWFGATHLNTQIIRTFQNGNLYLVSDNKRYLITSMKTFGQLGVISREIGYVSQQYIDTLEDGGAITKFVRNKDNGAIYLISDGKKFHINSCEMVEDYGAKCSDARNLTQAQLDKFNDGGTLTNFAKVDNRLYYIKQNVKTEIADEQAMKQLGISGKVNELSSFAIAGMGIKEPIVRSDILVQDEKQGDLYYINHRNEAYYVNGDIFAMKAIKELPIRTMTSDSVKLLNKRGDFLNTIKDESGASYALASGGKIKIGNAANATEITSELAGRIEIKISTGSMVLFSDSSVVYYVDGQNIHPIYDWDTVLSINPRGDIAKVPASIKKYFNIQNKGFIEVNRLVKAKNNAAVYMIDGAFGTKKYLSSFDIANSLGLANRILELDSNDIDKYPNSGDVSSLVNCSGNLFIASSGKLKYVSGEKLNQYGLSGDNFVKYSQETCAKFSKEGALTDFALAKNGAIYKIENGEKRHILSYRKFEELGGSKNNLLTFDDQALSLIKTGRPY